MIFLRFAITNSFIFRKDKKMNTKKVRPLKRSIMFLLLPIMIAVFAVVFIATYSNTRNVLYENVETEAYEKLQVVDYSVLSDLNSTLGIMNNVKKSTELNCASEEEIQKYMYSVADAYLDIIPNGLYCGLESGTYIDKLWTPDADWVMKERPWYIEGLKADEVTMGEMYVDADTGQYIISVYCNIQSADGKAIGVISADVPMDSIIKRIQDVKTLKDSRIFGVDKTSGLVFGDSTQKELEKNIMESEDATEKEIASMISKREIGKMVQCGEDHILVSEIEGTNFDLVYVIPDKTITSSLSGVKYASLGTSVVGIIILCLAVYFVVAIKLRPVNTLKRAIFRMQALDMSEEIKIKGKDEIAQMAGALNDMSITLREMIDTMKHSIISIDENVSQNSEIAGVLAVSSEQQYSSVDHLSETMNELNRAIEDISIGANGLVTTVSDTAKRINEADEMISKTKQEIGNGHHAMNNMTGTMNSITSLSQALKDAVADVKDGVDGIVEMVTVINEIASQTSLLSLNASIEAARAGEAGKGFAVVASEISSLANTCATSVAQIQETTENMKRLVEVVLNKTNESMEAVNLGGDAVKETEKIFENISGNMENISGIMDVVNSAFRNVESVAEDMAASTQEQTASTTMVLSTSNEIKEMSRKFNEDGNEMNAQGQVLKELSNDLEEQVGKFIL